MKIYFACSITGGREFEAAYQQIVEALTKAGHIIPTSHLVLSESMDKERVLSPIDVYKRDVKWVEESDVLIAEVSTPSHGVGYEIGYALNFGKPVLCLYKNGVRVSKMISGNPAVRLHSYETVNEAVTQAEKFMSETSLFVNKITKNK